MSSTTSAVLRLQNLPFELAGARLIRGCLLILSFLGGTTWASDHADPIDPFNREQLEAGITDLFVFPIDENGAPVFPFERTDGVSLSMPDVKPRPALTAEQQAKIKELVVILCVRRQLTQSGTLNLEPYHYQIHFDLHSTVSFADSEADLAQPHADEGGSGYHTHDTENPARRPTGQEARARYGGSILRPEAISADAVIELRLKNNASPNGDPRFLGTGLKDTKSIKLWTGVRDDPFIFPAFFGTNVVAMVLRIPITCFPVGQQDWIVWANSHKGKRQIDHVGRSLRTQNPRFELLNTLPPAEHAAAIQDEHENPGLLRDLALRFNFQSLFAYRKWDFVPDVMIYTNRYPVGFPNGRLLTDDVAALLAQHGDPLLLELSHHGGGWPRQTTNDKDFTAAFPYLVDPWPDRPPPPTPSLSRASWLKIAGIVALALLALVLENWFVVWLYRRKQHKRRYL